MGADVELLKKSFSKGLHPLKLMRAVLGVPGKKEKKKKKRSAVATIKPEQNARF